MISQFHQVTLDILEYNPVVENQNISLLQNIEENNNISLPKSFFEWYSYQESIKILTKHSGGDEPLGFQDITEASKFPSGYRHWIFPKKSYLPFMVEQQGLYVWCIKLEDKEDPPVGYWEEGVWVPYTTSFSDFIRKQIWDHMNRGSFYSTSISGDTTFIHHVRDVISQFNWRYTASYPSGIHHLKTEVGNAVLWFNNTEINILLYAESRAGVKQIFAMIENFLPIEKPKWLK